MEGSPLHGISFGGRDRCGGLSFFSDRIEDSLLVLTGFSDRRMNYSGEDSISKEEISLKIKKHNRRLFNTFIECFGRGFSTCSQPSPGTEVSLEYILRRRERRGEGFSDPLFR